MAVDLLNCDVINASWSRRRGSIPDHQFGLLAEAVYHAYIHDVTLVATRGNNNNADYVFPGCFEDRMVLCVGGSDSTGTRANNPSGFGSSYGPPMDLLAPGSADMVFTTDTISGYRTFDGTSAAAPQVAAIAALMMSTFNSPTVPSQRLYPRDIQEILKATCTDKGTAGYDNDHGWGLANAGAAMYQLQSPRFQLEHHRISSGPASLETQSPELAVMEAIYHHSGPLPNGTYATRRYRVAQTVNFSYSASTRILGVWPREVSSIG